MVPAYLELLGDLPNDTTLAFISPRPPDPQQLLQIGRSVRYLPSALVSSVRIGDWAGYPTVTAEGQWHAARFEYRPTHLSGRDAAQAGHDDAAGRQLAALLYGKHQDIPLIMMYSHIHLNGAGTALVSHRVITGNEQLSLTAIRDLLRAHLNVEQVVFIPVPPGEKAGRIDGLVRFASEKRILLARPPVTEPDARAFSDAVRDLLRDELGPEFDIWPVPVDIPDWKSIGGNYLHLVLTPHHVLVPHYDLPGDAPALQSLQSAFPNKDVRSVRATSLLRFADEGKALNRVIVPH